LARGAVIELAQAQARLLELANPLPTKLLAIKDSYGRYLAQDVNAVRNQPAANLSAMDGFAIRHADSAGPWKIIGTSAAGRPFDGELNAGEAVRIFTGAHVPAGGDTILIQENTVAVENMLSVNEKTSTELGQHIRAQGSDFVQGERLLAAGDALNAGAVAAAAMAGLGEIFVHNRPLVSIIATGDELVEPGRSCSQAQIPSSNSVMIAAMLAKYPCDVVDCGTVRDNLPDIEAALSSSAHSDVIVTIGGASVGDHDLVQAALRNVGANIDFWRVAIKPGKPLMAGTLKNSVILGLPGNPGSAFVTAFLFLLPLIKHLSGSKQPFPTARQANLASDMPATGNRMEFVRSKFDGSTLHPFAQQDSSLTTPLANANALIIRPLLANFAPAGSTVSYYSIDV
jgi:molybdopterin molybdotransferase